MQCLYMVNKLLQTSGNYITLPRILQLLNDSYILQFGDEFINITNFTASLSSGWVLHT